MSLLHALCRGKRRDPPKGARLFSALTHELRNLSSLFYYIIARLWLISLINKQSLIFLNLQCLACFAKSALILRNYPSLRGCLVAKTYISIAKTDENAKQKKNSFPAPLSFCYSFAFTYVYMHINYTYTYELLGSCFSSDYTIYISQP